MLELLCAVLFGINGIMRLYIGISHQRGFEFALAAVWLAGAAIWYVRFLKKKRD